MKAYRVRLMGTNDSYLVTQRQKLALDKAIEGKGVVVQINGDTIRTSAIKSISSMNVDLDACPDYFIEAVEREQGDRPSESEPSYKKLPTACLIVGEDGEVLAERPSRYWLKNIATAMAMTGKHFYVADCHYRMGDAGPEYITKLSMMPCATEVRPDADDPEFSPIIEVYHYGERQFHKNGLE